MPGTSSSSPSASRASLSWQALPQKPGIYIYKNETGQIIYVGKAKSLRERVRSYFQSPQQLGPKTAALVSQIISIEYIEVGSEVEALLLESKLIKKHVPQYNIASKDDKSPYYIHISKEEYPRPLINHEPTHAAAGPFLNSITARRILKQFRRIAPYCSSNRPVKRPCLYSHLGLCSPCPGDIRSLSVDEQIESKLQYRRNITRLKSLLSGNFKQVLSQLNKDMLSNSKQENFEEAKLIRDQIVALEYLLKQPISPEEYVSNPNLVSDKRLEAISALQNAIMTYTPLQVNELKRIEMYDIANLQGTSATGAMTVAINGELNSKWYRHFTIKSKSTPDDVSMMMEMLSRRLRRTDWPYPDLIVLDGGKSQLSIVNKLSEEFTSLPPMVSLAKKEETIIIPQLNNEYKELKLPLDHPGLKLIINLRDEAHRFSRRLHHKHRAKLIS